MFNFLDIFKKKVSPTSTYQAPTPNGQPIEQPKDFINTLSSSLSKVVAPPPKKQIPFSYKPQPVSLEEQSRRDNSFGGLFINTLGESVKKIAQMGNIITDPLNSGKAILRGTAREIASVGITVGQNLSAGNLINFNPIGLNIQKFNPVKDTFVVPRKGWEQFIFGEEPIGGITEEAGVITKQSAKSTEEIFNMKPGSIENNSFFKKGILPFMAFSQIVGDLYTGGKSKGLTSLVDDTIKSTTIHETEKLLRDVNFSEDIVKKYSVPLTENTSTSEATKIIKEATAEHSQNLMNKANEELAVLNEKQKEGAILSADEIQKQEFLSKNKNKPEVLNATYQNERIDVSQDTPESLLERDSMAKREAQVVNPKLTEKLAKTNTTIGVSDTLRKEGYIPTEQNILDLKNTSDADEIKAILKTMEKDMTPQSTFQRYYDKVRTYIDDSAQAAKRAVQNKEYQKTGELNLYEDRSIFPNILRVEVNKIKSEGEAIITRLENAQKELKIPNLVDDANSYAKYKNSIEYNKLHGEGTSGVSTESAQAELKRIEEQPHFKEVEKAQKELVEFNKKILKETLDAGNITKEAYDEMNLAYENYVTMNRVMDEVGRDTMAGIGGVTDTLGSGIKKRKGSVREVRNVFENSVENAIRLSNRNQKNLFNNRIAEEVRNNDFLGKVVSAEDFKTTEKAMDRNVIAFNENGKKKLIVFKDPLVAEAISGANLVSSGTASVVMNTIGTLTRIYNNLLTRFNVGFMGANPIRDIQEMSVALDSLNLQKGTVTKTALGVPIAQKEIANHIYRGIPSKDYDELLSLGGAQGGQSLSLKPDINPEKAGRKNIIKQVVKQFDQANEVLENGTRLSVYKTLKKAGVPKERAAYIANEATINYSRKGTAGPLINSLYSFANVTFQANAKFLRAMKNPKTASKVLAIVYGASLAQSQYNDMVAPDWRKQVPEKTRDTNLIIVYGKKPDGSLNYFTMPLAQSLRPIFIASNAINGDVPQKKSLTRKILGSMFDMFNPIGGSLDNPISMFTPTIARPLTDVGQNKSWTGSNIKPDTFGREVPESERYYDSLHNSFMGEGLIKGTKEIAKQGVELSPADVEYLIKQSSGGLGQTIINATQSIKNAISKEPIKKTEIPLVSRFLKETDIEKMTDYPDETLKDTVMEQERKSIQNKREAGKLYDEWSKLPPDEAAIKWEELNQTNKPLAQKIIDIANERKLGLTSREKKINQLNVENGERAKYLYKEIMDLPPEKRAEKWQEYKDKKMISSQVEEQIRWLIKNGGSTE